MLRDKMFWIAVRGFGRIVFWCYPIILHFIAAIRITPSEFADFIKDLFDFFWLSAWKGF